jgi:hypothetical protein
MTETPDARTLAASLEDADPLQALRAVAALNAEADRVAAVLVRRARNAGCTWAQVAEALGVSRQAVHKRYGR